MTRLLLGLLLGLCTSAIPASAEEAISNRVRITTDRLDLVFSVEGAVPVMWRACHPSCAPADAGGGTSVRFTSPGDPPQPRLILQGPAALVDLQRLRFTAALTGASA